MKTIIDKYNRQINVIITDNNLIIYSCNGIEMSWDYPGPPEHEVIEKIENMLTAECSVDLIENVKTDQEKIEDLKSQVEKLENLIFQLIKDKNEKL